MRKADKEYIDSLTDQEVVAAILDRDTRITRLYLYEKCYPLFSACFNKYYTDCESCIEFINEIYTYILYPLPTTGRCHLGAFGFTCQLTWWLKVVIENYCRQLFKKRIPLNQDEDSESDRKHVISESLDIHSINRMDVEAVLSLMRNSRYRALIRFRYLEEKSNEETAELLGMSMDNYYNKHRLAKEQFATVLRKEGLL